ncbi:hypothetical protein [Ottowia flava]|nr:hypothetical protein [Ottowia sp. GY511]
MRKPGGHAAGLPIRWAVLTLCGAALALPAVAGGNGGNGGGVGGGGNPGTAGDMATGRGGAGGLGRSGALGGSGGNPGLVVSSAYENAAGAAVAGQTGGIGVGGPVASGVTGSGGGGGGGDGLVLNAGASLVNRGALRGGDGGLGGDVGGFFGGGGGGGAGLVASGAVTNSGTITGGVGASYRPLTLPGIGGSGAGVVASGATIVNQAGASILGGRAPAVALTFVNGAGAGGNGAGGATGSTLNDPGGGQSGAGITGDNLNIVNKGQIARGDGGFVPGVGSFGPANPYAIWFGQGTNRLELHPGFSFTGIVRGDGDDVLALGSAAGDDGNMALPTLTAPAYEGFDAYEKTGPGRWTVTGAQADAATAGWKLVEGRLNLNGAQLGALTLAGGALTGNGQVAALVGGPGTVAPGNSVGTLTVTGATTLAGATYAAEIDPGPGTADLLAVNGANLAGGNLTVTSLGGAPGVGQTFTVVSGTGIIGQFATVTFTDNFPTVTPEVQYSASRVQIVYKAAAPAATVLRLNPIANVAQGVAPQLSGTSVPPVSGPVQVVLTAGAQVVTLQAQMVNGVWTLTGPANLPVGPVTVQASMPGSNPPVAPITGQFAVTAGPPVVAVPVNSGWMLVALAALLGGLGMRRRRAR